MIKINANCYAVDSIEVIEIRKQVESTKSRTRTPYEVVIHMKSGKSFVAFKDKSFEDALGERTGIMKELTKPFTVFQFNDEQSKMYRKETDGK